MQPNRKVSIVAGITLSLGLGLLSLPAVFGESSAMLAAQSGVPINSNTIADIAERSSPAIVNLEMRKKLNMNASALGLPPGISEFFFNGQKIPLQNMFELQEPPSAEPQGNAPGAVPNSANKDKAAPPVPLSEKHDTATGFVIRPDGYIITNAHAVGGQDNIRVTLQDNRTLDAKVVGIDYFSDLAVIKVDANNLSTLPWGKSSSLRPGEFAVAIGSPLGYDHTVTLGIISAVGRSVTDVNGNINFIQTDAAINPGNSGGPLLNMNGEVVGVNTAILKVAQNIGFSIPADVAKEVAEELIKSGEIKRPWLGVKMADLDDAYIKGSGLAAGTKGVLIRGFIQGSPGQASGLKLNDIIQKVDGKETVHPKDVRDCVLGRKPGDVLNLIVLRNNAVQSVTVSVGTYPKQVNPIR